MLLGTTQLPYSFFNLLTETVSVVNETYAHRPDKLVKDYYEEDFFIEAMCNEASNVSPISFVPGTVCHLPSRLFMRHFLEVGGGNTF